MYTYFCYHVFNFQDLFPFLYNIFTTYFLCVSLISFSFLEEKYLFFSRRKISFLNYIFPDISSFLLFTLFLFPWNSFYSMYLFWSFIWALILYLYFISIYYLSNVSICLTKGVSMEQCIRVQLVNWWALLKCSWDRTWPLYCQMPANISLLHWTSHFPQQWMSGEHKLCFQHSGSQVGADFH